MRWAGVWATLAAAALAGGLALIWWHSGETTAATLATVVAAALAASGPLASWLPAKTGDAGSVDDQLERLATVVRLQWEKEANYRQLRDPQPIEVRWSAADPRLMDHPEVIVGERPLRSRSGVAARPLALAGGLNDLVEAYGQLARRRLVVLGEPGAGKTGVLVLLTLGLLERWKPGEPVPVLLSLASWDPERTSFLDWLARHLADEHHFIRSDSAGVAVARRVLPLLDGLDELPDHAAAAAIQKINAVGLDRPLVVACPSLEFARAVHSGDVLTGAAAVQLERIAPIQAETYLRLTTPPDDRLARWNPVFAELRRGLASPVAAALSTPLMLTLARTVYALDRSADPRELVELGRSSNRLAIEDRLLDALVPALYRAGPARWPAGRARNWLTFLAGHLRRRRTQDLAWWELASSEGLLGGLGPTITAFWGCALVFLLIGSMAERLARSGVATYVVGLIFAAGLLVAFLVAGLVLWGSMLEVGRVSRAQRR